MPVRAFGLASWWDRPPSCTRPGFRDLDFLSTRSAGVLWQCGASLYLNKMYGIKYFVHVHLRLVLLWLVSGVLSERRAWPFLLPPKASL